MVVMEVTMQAEALMSRKTLAKAHAVAYQQMLQNMQVKILTILLQIELATW